jgi:7-carboxy-7-deazaguanine synthase
MTTENENYLLISDDGPGFHTIEGEGEYLGYPSVFMRLFGCNLTCKGWASPDSPWGCDSYISWSKKNKYSFDQMFEFYEQNGLIHNLRRGDLWKITGGEPMLRQKPLLAFVEAFRVRYGFYPRIDFETNGTIMPDDSWFNNYEPTYTVSPKLASNGDPKEKRYVLETLRFHVDNFSCFKFVIKNEQDMQELFENYIEHPQLRLDPKRIWLMVCAGSRQEHIENAEAVAELCKKHGFKMSPRLHLMVWDKALKV